MRIEPEVILAETEYDGKGYSVLADRVNPYNKNMITFYSTQNPDNLAGFNRVISGSENYHNFRNFINFKMGSFRKQGLIWVAN